MITDTPEAVLQTIDVLDLSVINLSLYERLIMQRKPDVTERIEENETISIHRASQLIERNTLITRNSRADPKPNYTTDTVVILPILLAEKGASFSHTNNRKTYLAACFWSIYEHYDNIVAYVANQADHDYLL